MNRLLKSPVFRIAAVVVIVVLLVLAGLFVSFANDPLVTYYGTTVRISALQDQTETSLYCQQLASFSFGPNFACFDSQQELDEFADSRSDAS